MSSDDSKDKKPNLPHPPKNVGQKNRRGGRRQHQNRWNNPRGGLSTNNLIKTADLENDILDNTGAHDAAMFHCSLKQIANYIQLNYGKEVSEAIPVS